MRLETICNVIKSKEINNGYHFVYNDTVYDDRFAVVRSVLENVDSAIDLGCVGYIPNIEISLQQGTYLHEILTKNCKKVLGVDIEKDGIEYMKGLGYNNIIAADIFKDSELIKNDFKNGGVDLIVLGEILHEVDNPIAFLSNIKKIYSGFIKQMLITVPNIYRYANIINGLKGIDVNHTENRCWFSPYTLCKTVFLAGMTPREIFLAGKLKGKKGALIKLIARNNICCEHIVLLCDMI